jgi:hypothetical protein
MEGMNIRYSFNRGLNGNQGRSGGFGEEEEKYS